ncbi:MAG: transporter small permease [Deltaproteobacteria bacterium]|nr:transporter small permease [Deltaproteobacteria bacterium]
MKKIVVVMSYVGVGAVMCMALLTGVDVVGRYAFNKPVQGGVELVELLMGIIVACGVAVTTAADDHISVDTIFGKLPSSGKHVLRVFAGIICTFVFAILAWQGVNGGIDAVDSGRTTSILKVPISPFQFFLAIGFLASFMFLLVQTILLLRTKKG